MSVPTLLDEARSPDQFSAIATICPVRKRYWQQSALLVIPNRLPTLARFRDQVWFLCSALVTLVKGDLRGISVARELSQAAITNMKQNLGFAFIYNVLGVPLAAGVLFPFTGWLLSPMIAALAMSLSSASVITNALRLRGKK